MTSFNDPRSSSRSGPNEEDLNRLKETKDPSTYVRYPILQILLTEVKRGVDKYGDFESLEQFRGVLKEEFQEVMDELDAEPVVLYKVYAEVIQVAAVAIRAIEEMERRTLG